YRDAGEPPGRLPRLLARAGGGGDPSRLQAAKTCGRGRDPSRAAFLWLGRAQWRRLVSPTGARSHVDHVFSLTSLNSSNCFRRNSGSGPDLFFAYVKTRSGSAPDLGAPEGLRARRVAPPSPRLLLVIAPRLVLPCFLRLPWFSS